MVDEYQQLSQHRQRARCAVQHEREGYYHRAAEAWQSVARLAPNIAWQRWALLRASICLQRAEERLHARNVRETKLSRP
ncbi:hypothetical protein [Hafnia sp.]|uniref:hypothetical protein n=1 Tax=Hafnia sp. TaxID=1873498 RepID=UPI002FC648D2